MKLLFVLACVILTASALGVRDEWENYKITYGKTYKSTWEDRRRLVVYLETMIRIKEHNKKFEKSKTTYKMGITKFADWTQEEIDAFLKSSYSSSLPFKQENVPKFNKANLGIRPPAAYDWRDKDVVTEVKDQGECNAGWAFAAAGALETSLWYFTKKLRSISAQGLIDCVGSNMNGGNNGCSPLNKTVKDAYDFMIEKGFAFVDDYPFTSENGKSGECKISKFSEELREYNVLPKGDEKNLQETVAFSSPIAAMIDATPLLNYESGIIDANASCKKDSPNHAVVIVGYGTDNGTDYWTLKNSFGKNWGEDGYFRLQRGSNVCGIASAAIEPVFRC